jgi:hypothetical protein
VIASLLPGLRELRAPLAAGFSWLLVLYLWVSPSIPTNPDQLKGASRQLWLLADWLGKTAILATLSFCAYLIGIVSEWVTNALVHWLDFLNYSPLAPISPGIRRVRANDELLRETAIRLLVGRLKRDESFQSEIVSRMFSEHAGGEVLDGFRESVKQSETVGRQAIREYVNLDDYVNIGREDLGNARYLLSGGDQPDLYSDWDRLRSEGDFRISLVLPLTALAVTAGLIVHPACLTLLLVCPALIYMGIGARAEADQLVGGALFAGRDLGFMWVHADRDSIAWKVRD